MKKCWSWVRRSSLLFSCYSCTIFMVVRLDYASKNYQWRSFCCSALLISGDTFVEWINGGWRIVLSCQYRKDFIDIFIQLKTIKMEIWHCKKRNKLLPYRIGHQIFKQLGNIYGSISKRPIIPPRISKTLVRRSQMDRTNITRYDISVSSSFWYEAL